MDTCTIFQLVQYEIKSTSISKQYYNNLSINLPNTIKLNVILVTIISFRFRMFIITYIHTIL